MESIKVLIERETEHGSFRDCLILTQEEFSDLSFVEIKSLEDQRVDNWIASIENASQQQED